MKYTIGIIINNPCKELGSLTEHRNPLTLPFFARYRLVDFAMSNMVNSEITKIGVIASDKYRSLLDHVGTGQEWGLSRKSQSMVILQGIKKIGNVNSRDINIMDFENNRMVFNRSKLENILVSTPNIVCNIDYNDVVSQHKESNADITLVGAAISLENDQPNCIFMNVDEEGHVIEMTIGANERSTHKYSGKLVIKKETMHHLMELAPEAGEYEMLTLILELFNTMNIMCYKFSGYLRWITSVKSLMDANLELLDKGKACELFHGDRTVYTKIKDNHPTLYKESSNVKNSCIASGSIIHGEVRHSVLAREIFQEKNSIITNSILMGGNHVGEGTQLDYVVADKNVTISKNVVLKGTKESPVVLKKGTVI